MNSEISRIMHSILVNAVVFKEDKVLVSKRSLEEAHEPGKWTIPGGKVEKPDSETFNIIESTLKREVEEETGVIINYNIQLVTNNTFTRSNGQHVVAIIFSCDYQSGDARPLEDTIDCKWVTKKEVELMEFPPNVKGYILKSFELRESE